MRTKKYFVTELKLNLQNPFLKYEQKIDVNMSIDSGSTGYMVSTIKHTSVFRFHF